VAAWHTLVTRDSTQVFPLAGAQPFVVVQLTTPTLTTTPNPTTVTLSTSSVTLKDSATLSGGSSPTGTITFTLFYNGGPTPVDTETVTVSGNATYTTPTGFTLPTTGTVTGTYQWDASYSGDANNNPVSDDNDPTEKVAVSAASPTISTTQQPGTATVGTSIADKATVSGYNPTGTVTFNLYNNPNGTGTPLFTDANEPLVSGAATSKGFTTTATGTDYWVATYNGDSNNNPVTSGTGLEPVTITAATPAITTTQQPATATVGTSIADKATVTGGFNPTGTVTFNLYNNPNGTGTPLFTDANEPLVSGAATSKGFTTTAIGTDYWVATYNGDSNNNPVTSGTGLEPVTITMATPTISTTPSPATVTLGATAPPILTDSAVLSSGFQPTGTITFTLFYNGGTTPVDTETVTVNGNGSYTTPTGFKLPATGAVTGTYQWNTSYSGDTNNNSVTNNNAVNERVTVSAANPTISTTPSPITLTLGPGPEPPLTDTATLAGGFRPTGTITFTLFYNGGSTPVDTETVTVNGNGSYTTPTGFTLPTIGKVTGTYQWDATYSGDPNNNTASDTNALNELVTVSAARTTLTTTPSPTVVTLGSGPSPLLTDTADLEGGFRPNGTLTFTLFYNGSPTPVDTETVAVNGNGTYTTPTGFTLPTTGAVTGTYQWIASYSDKFGNNGPVTDANDPNERVTVVAASPTISTTPNPTTVMLGGTLQDVASLSGGYNPTGSITFNLYAPGVDPTVGPVAYTETVAVSGNGTYHTTTGFVSNATGTWHWVASYNGDPNNNSVASAPLVEPVTIAQQADLALSKTVNNPTPNVGDTVTFTVTLTNKGPDTATTVSVNDALPSGLTLVSATPSQGSYASGVWTVGTVGTSAAPTLTLAAKVVSPSAETNTAAISHSDQFDPNTANNSANATVTPQQADLALAKTVNDPTPNVGETVTFTVTLTNNGPNAATNVSVADALPSGLTLVSATPSQGTYAGGVWTVGTVAALAAPTLTLAALVVSPSAETNTATISHADQFDPDPGNNSATATVTPQQADLAVGKQVSNPTPNVGQTITYTVTVANNGPNTATNVALQDVLPAGVSYQSSSATEGSYNPATSTWTVGSVAVGATQTLTITVLVVSPNPASNTASISHSDQFDPDTANNSDTASINPQQADLELTKTVNNPTPNVGDTVTFIVTLTNNGPATATGVQVTDQLPAGLTFVSATPSQGSYVSSTGLWTVGTVAMAAMPTLQIQATVASPGAETNTATITAADQFDPNPGNNTASTTVTPQQADLAVTKMVNDPTPNVGETVTFTVALSNLGPQRGHERERR
jgi:uncharacterized repeat protein (TIGR01451 family)